MAFAELALVTFFLGPIRHVFAIPMTLKNERHRSLCRGALIFACHYIYTHSQYHFLLSLSQTVFYSVAYNTAILETQSAM